MGLVAVLLLLANVECVRLPEKPYQTIVRNVEGLDQLVDHFVVYRAEVGGQAIGLKRIGRDFDGGYVIPEIALQKCSAVLGYGVGGDLSFEEDAAQHFHL